MREAISISASNGARVRLALFFLLALSGCTTFKPPQISYDDDVPPFPDLPAPADDHARPLHVPPAWTPARGGNKVKRRQRTRPIVSRLPTMSRGSSPGAQGISTPSRSFPIALARSIKSMPRQGKSRISSSNRANS